MLFAVQKTDALSDDAVGDAIRSELLHAYSTEHSVIEIAEEELTDGGGDGFSQRLKSADALDDRLKDAIPLGRMSFVEKFLRIFHGIDFENAVEVPPCLREARFLKRRYSIVPVWEIPQSGRFFIKDATRQKVFSYKGELEYFLTDEMFAPKTDDWDLSLHFDYDHLYQVSEIVQVLAEYRVYVLGGRVETIAHFAGDPFALPDVSLIKDAVEIWNREPDCPGSYSLDLMVTPAGTAVTEAHNFLSLGLYTVNWDERLLYAYRDGWRWVLEHNTPQKAFSNFSD